MTEKYLPAEGKRRVFISCKKNDNKSSSVRDIVTQKISRMMDVAVWFDENLTPGANYKKEIIDYLPHLFDDDETLAIKTKAAM